MQKIKKIKNLLSSTAIFFFCLFFLFFYILKSAQTASVLEVKEDDVVLGNKNAPITIIEYASLSCIHCANFHQNTLPQLIEEYVDTGKIRIVFRDFPLNYPALMGSIVLQCVDHNIRYEYLSALFNLQSKWVNPESEITKKELFKIMQAGGMTKDQFNECLNNKDLEQKILQILIDAQNEFNIRTTPSFVINDNLLEGNKSIKEFKKIIDNILLNIE